MHIYNITAAKPAVDCQTAKVETLKSYRSIIIRLHVDRHA